MIELNQMIKKSPESFKALFFMYDVRCTMYASLKSGEFFDL